ncbi:Glu-tRNA(Gln) amidotransferase subunit GatE [archaeon]|nr:Glu-tRNA(Gln) amidotransferase subunit GatE [archaeon]
MAYDYKKLGFKAGLEIHCQLDTKHKLFCDCPTTKSNDFPIEIKRKLRAVSGELGKTDVAALHETKKNMIYTYKANPDTSCLVEFDSEPPHALNQEAIDVTLQLCKILGSKIINEIHVMRKTVIDGSNTSGFQRTVLIGTGGLVDTSKGKVRITNIQLEEDSATPLERTPTEITYRLDRLGIPLIELGTEPDIQNPEHLKETALSIGALLIVTGKTKREIGSIRQDLNISIAGGTRVEIKGAQEPSMFPLIAEREVQRQVNLIATKTELENRQAKIGQIIEITELFIDSPCNFIRNAKCVMALSLENFADMIGKEIQPGRRVGTEISDYAKIAGVGGIIHSDEDLHKYNLEEEPKIRQKLGIQAKDAFILIASDPKLARRAIEFARERTSQLFKGVPNEVRKALKDGNTSFMRPMPGAARLYPETDCTSILLTPAKLRKIKKLEKPEKTRQKLLKTGLSKDLTEKLMNSPYLPVFNKIKSKHSSLVAATLTDTIIMLRRDEYQTDQINEKHLIDLFKLYDKNKFAKESIPSILEAITLNQDKKVEDLIDALSFTQMDKKQLKLIILDIIDANQNAIGSPKAFTIIMGEVMKKLRGKADGALIAKILKEELADPPKPKHEHPTIPQAKEL